MSLASEAPGRPRTSRLCANCGHDAPDDYCPACGQSTRDRVVALRDLTREFLDDQLSLNSSLARTIPALLFQPGRLTAEYLRGRRARYIRPVRIYLLSVVAFLLVLAPVRDRALRTAAAGLAEADSTIADVRDAAGEAVATGPGDEAAGAGTPAAAEAEPARGRPKINIPLTGSHTKTELEENLERRIDRAVHRFDTPAEWIEYFARRFEEYLPRLMFVLLPVFAVLLKLLYARRGRLYVEHFVFSLHFHAFAFALFTGLMLVALAGLGNHFGWAILWMSVYLWLAMKRVYGQGWVRTSVKFVLLTGIYQIVQMLAFMALVVLSVLML